MNLCIHTYTPPRLVIRVVKNPRKMQNWVQDSNNAPAERKTDSVGYFLTIQKLKQQQSIPQTQTCL